jgi:Rps23 Pro-64 3,4-dihydroxylase Tpa1-like proline 4-hydroxylase
MLDPNIGEGAQDLNRQFVSAEPFRHVVIEKFLEPQFCRELMNQFPSFDAKHALNEMGDVGRKAVVTDLKRIGPAYAQFDAAIRSRGFLDTMSRITGIPDLLYDPEYVGGGTHENLNGQDLDTHVDFNYHPKRHWHRRLNLIVFLNEEWDETWGGCLELVRDPWTGDAAQPKRIVVPSANRAVIFETNERSWHGFRRIELPDSKRGFSRRSLAIYLYTRKRPAEEVAASHATIYVQRQLPEHLAPGHTLREDDIEDIRALIQRRDSHMRFLYGREREFSEALENMLQSPSFKIGRALTWPARALRKVAHALVRAVFTLV